MAFKKSKSTLVSMYDILSSSDAKLLKRAKQRGIEPFIVGDSITLVGDRKELAKVSSLLVFAQTNNMDVLKGPIDGVVDIEHVVSKKDHFHFRRGGLFEVEARQLANDGKYLIVSMQSIRKAKNRAQTIGRIVQNVWLASKAGLPVIFTSFAAEMNELCTIHDLHAFFVSLGVAEQITQKSQESFTKMIESARLRASDAYIGEGIKRTEAI